MDNVDTNSDVRKGKYDIKKPDDRYQVIEAMSHKFACFEWIIHDLESQIDDILGEFYAILKDGDFDSSHLAKIYRTTKHHCSYFEYWAEEILSVVRELDGLSCYFIENDDEI